MSTQDFTKVDPATLDREALEALDDEDFAALRNRQMEAVNETTAGKYKQLNELLYHKKQLAANVATVDAQIALLYADLGK